MLEAAETPEEIEAIQNTLEMLDLSIEEKIENTAKAKALKLQILM